MGTATQKSTMLTQGIANFVKEKTNRSVPKLNNFIKDMGYISENHIYKTRDGNTNSIIRIPGITEGFKP